LQDIGGYVRERIAVKTIVGHEFGDAAHAVEVGELGLEGLDFWGAHIFGMAFVVEEEVAFDSVTVSLFGAVRCSAWCAGCHELDREVFSLKLLTPWQVEVIFYIEAK